MLDLSLAEGKLDCTSEALTSLGRSRASSKYRSSKSQVSDQTRRLQAAG
jgi:hypothetical protein